MESGERREVDFHKMIFLKSSPGAAFLFYGFGGLLIFIHFCCLNKNDKNIFNIFIDIYQLYFNR